MWKPGCRGMWSEFDMTVLTIAAHHITIGPENAPARDRIRLRGLVFSTDFFLPRRIGFTR